MISISMSNSGETEFFRRAKILHPKSVQFATQLTRKGQQEVKRYSGPGKRSKNPREYDKRFSELAGHTKSPHAK